MAGKIHETPTRGKQASVTLIEQLRGKGAGEGEGQPMERALTLKKTPINSKTLLTALWF